MASAYTPGLTVSASTTIRKTRRLPLKGDVLVSAGAVVAPDAVVARAALPGPLQTVRVASQLGVDAGDVPGALLVKVGDVIEPETLIARTKGLFGLFTSEVKAGVTGAVEIISPVSGNVGVRAASLPIDVTAYVPGTVVEVLPGEGVIIEARGAALVQGIFGVGGERRAPLARAAKTPDATLDADDLTASAHAGKVVVGGGRVTLAALRRAAEVNAAGIVAGGIVDTDLAEFLGYDIGVAITGYEDIPFTLILTEGFGDIAMAARTFDLLADLDGREACFSGATQIRAGVLRPEVIVPGASEGAAALADDAADAFTLVVGTPIRLIREPYFGRLAVVTALPPEPARVPSGAVVRVLEARLDGTGEAVSVPRANVEIVSSR